MLKLLTTAAFALPCLAFANDYTGQWSSVYKVYGPSRVTMTGRKLTGTLRNTLNGASYAIKGTVVSRVFTGAVKDGNAWRPAFGTCTYGTRKMSLRVNVGGFWFDVSGSR